MPVPLRFTLPDLPEGSELTPQQLLDFIADGLQGYFDGVGLSGQLGGNRPASDVGLYVDIEGRAVEIFDPESGDGEYVTVSGPPVGGLIPFAGKTDAQIPDNYLLCDGSEVSQETYARLFEILGDAWGTAGTGLFRLPDLRNRIPVGVGEGDAKAGTYNAGNNGVAGAMLELSVGDYIGSEGLRNVAKALGGPSPAESFRGRVAPDHDAKANMTSVYQPGAVMRWIIRYR